MAPSSQSLAEESFAPFLRPITGRRLLGAVAVIVAIFNLLLMIRRMHWRCPLTAWDAGMIVDGWRALHHLPTYAADHATNMYGPLLNVSSGLLFRLTGVNNFTLRVFELTCYCGAAIILAIAVTPRGWRLVSLSILAIANIRTSVYWVLPNPDGAALLFTVIFVVLAYKNRMVLASLALVVAVLFKQPSAVAAVIPLAAALPRPRLRTFAPLLAVGATLVTIRIFFPLVYYYMFTVPKAAPYQLYRFAKAPVDMLVGLPILLVVVATWKPNWNRIERWFVWAISISFIAGTVMSARVGGIMNSYMIFIMAALAFSCYRLPHLDRVSTVAAAVAVLLTAFAYVAMPIGASTEHHGDGKYESAIAVARELPGTIVCPEDPTIPMYAKGYAGTIVNMEMDAENQFRRLPQRVQRELGTADWVLTMDPARISETKLNEMGFRRVDAEPLRGSTYKLWQRAQPERTPMM